MTTRAMLIRSNLTVADNIGTPVATPPLGDLGELLNRFAKRMPEGGVILIDQAVADRLGIPGGDGPQLGLTDVQASGWKHNKDVRAYTRFWRDDVTIVVGNLNAMNPERTPLLCDGDIDTVAAFGMWHEWTGIPWRDTPGATGLALIDATVPEILVKGRPSKPTWKPKDPGPEGASEAPWTAHNWPGPSGVTALPHRHGYDVTRMYLAAAGQCEHLPAFTLRRQVGRSSFDPKMGGWWKVRLAPWIDQRIPHPAGPGDDERWITTPTAVLLSKLAEDGVYGGFEVLDSRVGPGKRLLRGWAETIERTYTETVCMGTWSTEGVEANHVAAAAKAVYRESIGLLNRDTNWMFRPDWHYSIIALARCNLWRKMWRVGREEDRWPLTIDVDNVVYGSADVDPVAAVPKVLTLGDRPGQFKVKGAAA